MFGIFGFIARVCVGIVLGTDGFSGNGFFALWKSGVTWATVSFWNCTHCCNRKMILSPSTD